MHLRSKFINNFFGQLFFGQEYFWGQFIYEVKVAFNSNENAGWLALESVVLLSINGLCMKESNTLADNVAIKHHQRVILLSIKGLCMKESNTLADTVANVFRSGIFDNIFKTFD